MVATRSSRKRTRSGRLLAEPPATIVRRGEQLITLLQATQEQGCYAVACENVNPVPSHKRRLRAIVEPYEE